MLKERFQNNESSAETEKRASGILRYVEKTILGSENLQTDRELEEEIRADYHSRTPREKADILYEKVMAYVTDKKTHAAELRKGKGENQPFVLSDDLKAEIKVLLEDQSTRDLFSKTYAQARVDAKSYRLSDLGQTWNHLNEQIEKLENEFQQTEQALFLKTIEGKSNVSSARSKAERLAKRLLTLKGQREDLKMVNLENVFHTPENTDVAAMFQFETVTEYADQLKNGFVWLPSRERIHTDTVAALQNGRWPVLVGEAGTGKSDQADAAALELTGSLPTEVECEATTGEKQLVMDVAIDSQTGGSYQEYGPLMKAFTGFDDSRQTKPSSSKGRIARFDESGRLGSKAYSVIKKARQKGSGDDFYGRPVLPGAAAIWTTNPTGTRYPDRHPVDPAMRREIAEIYVDYPEQSAENPEQYEFMLGALLDENRHIPGVAETELAPAYTKQEFAEDQKYKLPDGRTVVAKDVLIEDASDKKHGTLWRLANAVKALQNSFIYGNHFPEKIPSDALFIDDDNSEIKTDGTGSLLILSTSTITLGEVKSWMQGFRDRLQKQNEAFQVETFSEWIKLKIDIYLKQVDQADRAKIKAIFEHFHLLDAPPDVEREKPLTPKQIGYLSPRVPRPLHVEAPVAEVKPPDEPKEGEKKPELYTTVEVALEDGSNIRIRKGDTAFDTKVTKGLGVVARKANSFVPGSGHAPSKQTRFLVNGREYVFSGMLEDGSKPVGSLFEEPDLHTIFTPEEVEQGIIQYSFQKLEKDVEAFCTMTST
ncbi:AAA family ATPase [Candidatus Uhrbacteria bacterium]|nr:AAA family ATPase [Candidatus Uhrbacteria bacterium]